MTSTPSASICRSTGNVTTFATLRRTSSPSISPHIVVYRAADVQTPYAKLRTLPHAEACLKPSISFAQLDPEAHAHSDLQAARALNAKRDRLFRTIAEARPEVA